MPSNPSFPPNSIKNIVPLSTALADETGYWRRVPFVVGIMFGVSMAVLAPLLTGDPFFPPLITALIVGIVGGLAFGSLFPLSLRRKMDSYTTGLYRSEPWITNPPPPGFQPTSQLTCTQVDSRIGIGGVLYMSREAWAFVPHKKSRGKKDPLIVSPLASIKLELVAPLPRNFLQRLLIPRPLSPILITWQSGNMRLLIPEPAYTIQKLNQALAVN